MLAWKEKKRYVLILLVCVLFIGLLPQNAHAAGLSDDIAAVLPSNVPPIPSIDFAAYPYVVVQKMNDTQYRIDVWPTVNYYFGSPFFGSETYYLGSSSNVPPSIYYSWVSGESTWTKWDHGDNLRLGTRTTSTGEYKASEIASIIFSNFTIYHFDGSIAHESDVIYLPDVPEIGVPDVPNIRVDLPRNYVYQYALNDIPAQLYVDAYVVGGDQSVVYNWQRQIDGEWVLVDFGDPHVQYYTPVTSVEGSYRYRCMVTNTVDGRTAYAYSNPVYVLVGSSAFVPGEDGETISPGDQVIIDQVGQIGDDVGEIKDSIEQLPEDIKDGMQEVLDNERTEAEAEGNDFFDQIVEVVPDHTEQLLGPMQQLAHAFSYEGTEAVLFIPELKMPAIPGIVEGGTLLAAQTVNMETYVDMFPEAVVVVVQALLSVALCLFCFKELYSVISYFFMGGKENE